MILLAYLILIFSALQLVVALINILIEKNLPEAEILNEELVSVLIPARNEEKNIGNILNDLINQDYCNIEIIVFNDQSEDETAEAANLIAFRDKRISLISSEGLPEGWLGKNFACHSLSGHARGEYLLFLDADVRIGNRVINNSVSFSKKHRTGLVSLFPKQIIASSGEWITVPIMNYILLSLLPLVLVRKLRNPSLAAANGQFMFFNTGLYRSVEPHKMLKNNKVEDISTACLLKKRGITTACLLGDDNITCRMYNGFHEAVNGFSKNVIRFFGGSFILALIFWLVTTFGFLPVLYTLPSFLLIAYLATFLLTRIIISAASRQNIISNVFYLIPQQLVLGIFIYKSFIYKHFKEHKWKGRNIS